jgi:hypothetical protein
MGVLLGGFYMAGAASWVVREVARRLGGRGSLRRQFLKIKGKWEGKRWGIGPEEEADATGSSKGGGGSWMAEGRR